MTKSPPHIEPGNLLIDSALKSKLFILSHFPTFEGSLTDRSARIPHPANSTSSISGIPYAPPFPDVPAVPALQLLHKNRRLRVSPYGLKSPPVSSQRLTPLTERKNEYGTTVGLMDTSKFVRKHTNLPRGIDFRPMSSAGRTHFVPYFQRQGQVSLRELRHKNPRVESVPIVCTKAPSTIIPQCSNQPDTYRTHRERSPLLRRAFREVDRPDIWMFQPETKETFVIRSQSPLMKTRSELEAEKWKFIAERPKSRM